MDRQYYLDIAALGISMPVAADLVLHEKADHDAISKDAERFAEVLIETSERFKIPLALPHMNLELEKHVMLKILGIPDSEKDSYHFSTIPTDEMVAKLESASIEGWNAVLDAHLATTKYVIEKSDLLPVGMCIGPFSLMTKLVADPITPIALYGAGVTADEDEEVAIIEKALEMAVTLILKSIAAQISYGAKAIFIAEPAGNKVYLSPNQIEAGSDIFEHFVMKHNRRIKKYLDDAGVDLIFHCCGELIPEILKGYSSLHPVMISLGSSRKLWEDAAIVSKDIVLFGNLPSKKFYSDDLITVDQVRELGSEIKRKMKEVGHPYILSSECDVLSVPGCEETIMNKVMAIQES
jgi:uroporphyrinogen-III decarboxylase